MIAIFFISFFLIGVLWATFPQHQMQPQVLIPMQQPPQQQQQPMRTKEFSDNEFSDDDDDDSEMEDKFTDNDLITLKDQEPDRFYKYKYKRKYLKKLERILRGMVKYNRMRKKLL